MEALSLVRDCFVVGFGCLMKIGLRMVRYQSVILSFNYWSGVVDERLTQSRVVNARTRGPERSSMTLLVVCSKVGTGFVQVRH